MRRCPVAVSLLIALACCPTTPVHAQTLGTNRAPSTTGQFGLRGTTPPPPQRFIVPHLREGFGSGAWQVLDRNTLVTVGRVNFQAQEWPVADVDAVVHGGAAYLTTDRFSGSAIRSIDLTTGHDRGLIALPANELVREGVDPIAVGQRIVWPVLLGNGSGALRSVEPTNPITLGPGFFFDPAELPHCDIEPVFTPDMQRLIYMTYSNAATGNVRVLDAASLTSLAKIPLNLANQQDPINGVDPLVTPDGQTALIPLFDEVDKRARLTFVDLDTYVAVDAFSEVGRYPIEDVDLALAPDGTTVFWPVYNSVGTSRIEIFDALTRSHVGEIELADNEWPMRAVDPVFTPDGSELLVVTHTGSAGSGRLRVIDVASRTVVHELTLLANDWPVEELDLILTPDGNTALWQTFDAPFSGYLHVIDVASATETFAIDMEFNEVPVEGCDVVLDPGGSKAIVTTWRSAAARGRYRIVNLPLGPVIEIDLPMNEHPVPHIDPISLGDQVIVMTNDSATAQTRLRILRWSDGVQVGFREFAFGESSREGVDVVASWIQPDPDEDSVICPLPPPIPVDFAPSPASP